MAKWVLLNSIRFGTKKFREGKIIDDVQYDIAQIRACGAQLLPLSNAQAAAKSAQATGEQKRGNVDLEREAQPEWAPYMRVGQIAIADAATTGTLTFNEVEPDANYTVAITCIGSTAGSAANSSDVIAVSKATTGVTITIATAPVAGHTVTFDVIVVRV